MLVANVSCAANQQVGPAEPHRRAGRYVTQDIQANAPDPPTSSGVKTRDCTCAPAPERTRTDRGVKQPQSQR
jgi:hypothetical protein